jgi:hypothetical protein
MRLAAAGGVPVAVVAGLSSGLGATYALRGFGLFGFGPGVGDSLPLLQLAGFDVQPVARVLVAWALAGAAVGVALGRIRRPWRAALVAVLAVPVLLIASQASYALTRNLRFDEVLWNRPPGAGPWIEGVVLALAAALPGPVPGRWRHRIRPRT